VSKLELTPSQQCSGVQTRKCRPGCQSQIFKPDSDRVCSADSIPGRLEDSLAANMRAAQRTACGARRPGRPGKSDLVLPVWNLKPVALRYYPNRPGPGRRPCHRPVGSIVEGIVALKCWKSRNRLRRPTRTRSFAPALSDRGSSKSVRQNGTEGRHSPPNAKTYRLEPRARTGHAKDCGSREVPGKE
jgi:hypothetical protein